MPPVVLTLLQALFLLLLYVFVGRAVRAVVRDLSPMTPAPAVPKTRGSAPSATPRRRPERQREPTELVVHLPGVAPTVIQLEHHLDAAGVSFGRAPDATVQLDDPYVSDRHARVYRSDDGWFLTDAGSTNGTFCNKSKVTAPVRLNPGDQLAIGKTIVEVRR